jgi:hypothetical protein
MKLPLLRTLGVLALLVLAPCARAVTINFHGYVSSITVVYDPQDTLYKPVVPPVAVGDFLSGTLSPHPLIWGFTASSGNWTSGVPSTGQPSIFGGTLQYTIHTSSAGRGASITLIDPDGGTNWKSGTFVATEKGGYPYSWWSFEATVTVPDEGLPLGASAALLGSVLWIHRRRVLSAARADHAATS